METLPPNGSIKMPEDPKIIVQELFLLPLDPEVVQDLIKFPLITSVVENITMNPGEAPTTEVSLRFKLPFSKERQENAYSGNIFIGPDTSPNTLKITHIDLTTASSVARLNIGYTWSYYCHASNSWESTVNLDIPRSPTKLLHGYRRVKKLDDEFLFFDSDNHLIDDDYILDVIAATQQGLDVCSYVIQRLNRESSFSFASVFH